MRTFEFCLELYKIEVGNYPSTDDGLNELLKLDLLNRIPKDPWCLKYVYKSTSNGKRFEIKSYGADRKPGGDNVYTKDIIFSNDDLKY